MILPVLLPIVWMMPSDEFFIAALSLSEKTCLPAASFTESIILPFMWLTQPEQSIAPAATFLEPKPYFTPLLIAFCVSEKSELFAVCTRLSFRPRACTSPV